MKKMRLIKIVLSMVAICFLLVGCKGNDNSNATADEGVDTIKVWGFGDASTKELKKVSDAISKITKEKIGVNVELYRSLDTEKLNLALNSGEKLDLVFAHNLYQPSLVSTGVLTSLDDLYNEHAKDASKLVEKEDMQALYFNEKMYFLPQFGAHARASGFAMRKSVLDELGVNAKDIDSMDDMHNVLVKVKENYPELNPVVSSWAGGGMQKTFHVDDFASGLAVLENAFTDNTKITSLYETKEWQEFCKTMYQWNKEGLIMPDIISSTDNSPMSTIGFSAFENLVPGKEVTALNEWKQEIAVAELVPPLKDSERIKGSWSIPASSDNPEKAMELWNLMYTDPEIATLFTDGIEGEHYVYTDDSKTQIKLPDGVTDTGYTRISWIWPNYSLTPLWEGEDADIYEQVEKFNEEATKSPALGFVFDSTPVTNEMTACQNVVQKYETPLQWGTVDPDKQIPTFIKELKTAGLETIQKEAQKQLDDFLGNK